MSIAPASHAKPYVVPFASTSEACAPGTKSAASNSRGVWLRSLMKSSSGVNQPAPIHRPE
jgi:hypothetical protein